MRKYEAGAKTCQIWRYEARLQLEFCPGGQRTLIPICFDEMYVKWFWNCILLKVCGSGTLVNIWQIEVTEYTQ